MRDGGIVRSKSTYLGAVTAALVLSLLLQLPSGASAAVAPFCLPGTQAGKCEGPRGVAVDTETGHVYVADRGNNRINVFESNGGFLFSFGWGVDTGANQLETCTTASSCNAGIPGSGAGQFSSPSWVAVDNDATSAFQHDVYVGTDNFRVQKFKPTGEFIEAFGSQGTGACQFANADDPIAAGPDGNVYVADSFDKDGPGSEHVFVNRVIAFDSAGACLGEVGGKPLFEGPTETIFTFAVGPGGEIYVTIEGSGREIRKYSSSGVFEYNNKIETQGLAIDGSGRLFAKQAEGSIEGKPLHFFTEYSSSGAILKRFGYLVRVSLEVPAVAAFQSADGDLYASEGSEGIKYLQLPDPGPLVLTPRPCKFKAGTGGLGNTTAILEARINPEGLQTSFKFEYLTQHQFETEGGFKNAESTSAGSLSGDFELQEATIKAEGLDPETQYRCRVVAENAESVTPAQGEEGTFITREGFEFGPSWVSGVEETSATVFAEGNPLEIPATGQIEYIEDAKYQSNPPDAKFAGAQSAPTPELNFGSGNTMKLEQVTLTGLKPGTIYHYRLRARNGAPPQGLVCPHKEPECLELEHTFRTYLPEVGESDRRRYELVSPGGKNSAEVGVPGVAAGFLEPRFVRIQSAAESGEAVTYTSWTSFGQAQGAPSSSQYLSKRTEAGWATDNISPLGYIANALMPPYNGFSPDLRYGAFKTTLPPLTADCRQSSENMYLRDNETGELRCLSPESAEGPESACLVYGGASDGAGRVFLAGKPQGGANFTYELYERTPSGVQLISILPGGKPAAPREGTSFGPSGSFNGVENCQFTRTRLRDAISADGTKAFWTYRPKAAAEVATAGPGVRTLTISGAGAGTFTLGFEGQATGPLGYNASAAAIQAALEALPAIGAGNVGVSGANPYTVTFKGPLAGTGAGLSANSAELIVATELFVRVNGSETRQLDAIPSGQKKEKPGSGTPGGGIFWAASADGSVAYFTAESRLISGSKAGPGEADLYRYELEKPEPLADLTRGAVAGNVQGVVGASEDGSYLYFVAKGALAGGKVENSAGQEAEEGKYNLYLYHEGAPSFIATLSGEDQGDWSAEPRQLSARVSPDGRHLAFLSVEAQKLAEYDNTRLEGEHCQYGLTSENNAEFTGSARCTQSFLYDAQTGDLTCASCNPSGARPLGPAVLPGWTNGFEGPRFLSTDGGRFLFGSFDALLTGDVNDKSDVYEFERTGKGTCSAANPNFDPRSGGCHFLVSSGRSGDENFLIDASADGRDVFLSTRQALVGWDVNENFDVYDYREGGGFVEPSAAVPCVGEQGCRPPVTSPPPAASPSTPGFSGPGNVKPKKSKPKHHKKKHKHHHKKKHAKKQRRAGR
jgi:NHL repeat